jgi:alanine-glyoxylate transaminase/serine-glyoxylate transaminase/serine-pyruvate transaminase
MNFKSFVPPSRTLLGPGPSDVHPRVLEALARPTIGHLDPEFIRMMDETKALLQYAFKTNNDVTMVISGPGSAGMEACFVNLIERGDTVVVCENGVFGGRMRENVERCGGTAVIVNDEWGHAVDPDKVETALKKHANVKALALVHAETSTGARSDARALVDIAHRHNCLVILDAVTSLGGIPVEVDAWGVDAVYSGSQKCLSCTPGLSPITFNERAMEVVRRRKTKVQSWFMDLGLVTAYWGGKAKRAYHHTAPINALYGLHEALVMLQEEGLEAAWDRHAANHRDLRDGIEGLGLKFFVREAERLPQLNVISIPDGADDALVRRRLLDEFGLEIGAGLGPLAGKVWRVGLMGYSSRPANVQLCIAALENVLG